MAPPAAVNRQAASRVARLPVTRDVIEEAACVHRCRDRGQPFRLRRPPRGPGPARFPCARQPAGADPGSRHHCWTDASLSSSRPVAGTVPSRCARKTAPAAGAVTARQPMPRPPRPPAGAAGGNVSRKLLRETFAPAYAADASARARVAITTERDFLERLVQFWSNHFAVSVDKVAGAGPRRPHGARSHPPACAGQLRRHAAGGGAASGHAAVPGQPAVHRPDSLRRAAGQPPRPRPRAEREPGARDPRAAHAGRGRRLHAAGCARAGQHDHRLVHRWWRERTAARWRRAWCVLLPPRLARARCAAAARARRYAEDGLRAGQRRAARSRGERAYRAPCQHQAGAPFRRRRSARRRWSIRLTRAWLDSRGDLPTVYRALLDAPQSWQQPLAKYKTPS